MARGEFQVHMLNEAGIAKAGELGEVFSETLTKIEALVPVGRERALVVTKLQAERARWARAARTVVRRARP